MQVRGERHRTQIGETNALLPFVVHLTRPSLSSRDGAGRFGPGNRVGKGNPHAKRVAALRSALLEAVSEDDMRAVIATIVEQAKQGDVMAARVLFERVLGKPTEADFVERLERIEAFLSEREVEVA